MLYKDGLFYFAKGMNALEEDSIQIAIDCSDKLDAILWRNAHQTSGDSVLRKWLQDPLNTASLELQGSIESARGNYAVALHILDNAKKKEKLLGYTEPPLYARPVAMSIGKAHERTQNFGNAIKVYEDLLQRFPNSVFVYQALINANRKKGNIDKVKEYEKKLTEVTKPGAS